MALIDKLVAIADAIRSRTGRSTEMTLDQMPAEILSISGDGIALEKPVSKDINFYDYDGTLLYSYTFAEVSNMTALPPQPRHEGLTCEGWDCDLEKLKTYDRKMNVGATYITDDGTTRLYIHLERGRTSPTLGLLVNGTVTVDWGDGTEPDVVSGTSLGEGVTTPIHNYEEPGDYVIKLKPNNEFTFGKYRGVLMNSADIADSMNDIYKSALRKVELGRGITWLSEYAFSGCRSLSSITLPRVITQFASYAFSGCYSLRSIVLPSTIKHMVGYVFQNCYSLSTVIINEGVAELGNDVFYWCYALTDVTLPDSITTLEYNTFASCPAITNLVLPSGLKTIQGAPIGCKSLRYLDFSRLTEIPETETDNVLSGIPTDCEILVPASLYDSWIAETNWSKWAISMIFVREERRKG